MIHNSNNIKEIKIVIAGLDNAGKTSFLIALRQKYNFYETVKTLKPTIKIDYSSFDFIEFSVNFWDMGGQRKYREIYVNNPIYFTDTNYLYYFVDIQDEIKIEESINYLQDLIKIYRDMKYDNEILICFHKYDPKFKENKDFKNRVEMIKNLILNQNKDMKFQFFETTYYDISSLSKAISYSLNKLLNLELINKKTEKIVKDYGCNYAILYTNTGLIISDYYSESYEIMDSKNFEESISDKINDNLEFFQKLSDNQVNIDERLSLVKDNIEYVKKIKVEMEKGTIQFYLGVSVPIKKIEKIKIEVDSFKNDLKSSFK